MRFVNHHRGCCGTNPTRPDGSEWSHVIMLHNGADLRADTAAEILDELIPGYEGMDEPARLEARTAHAEQMALAAQDVHISSHQITDLGLLAVLRSPRTSALQIQDPERPEAAPSWDAEIPLVLLRTSYAPYTDAPMIRGNVHWVDPSSEQRYLSSLRAARIFDYWTHPVTAG